MFLANDNYKKLSFCIDGSGTTDSAELGINTIQEMKPILGKFHATVHKHSVSSPHVSVFSSTERASSMEKLEMTDSTPRVLPLKIELPEVIVMCGPLVRFMYCNYVINIALGIYINWYSVVRTVKLILVGINYLSFLIKSQQGNLVGKLLCVKTSKNTLLVNIHNKYHDVLTEFSSAVNAELPSNPTLGLDPSIDRDRSSRLVVYKQLATTCMKACSSQEMKCIVDLPTNREVSMLLLLRNLHQLRKLQKRRISYGVSREAAYNFVMDQVHVKRRYDGLAGSVKMEIELSKELVTARNSLLETVDRSCTGVT